MIISVIIDSICNMVCRSLHCLDGTENSLFEGLQACFLRKRDKEVPLETSLRFSEEESPPTTMRAGLLPAPQWLFLKRLLYSFSILVSGRQSPSLTQRLDLLDPERASWSLCYGRFIASCSKERLQSHASPCTHHVSSSLPAYIDLVLFPYRFRIVSASGSENDRRTIRDQYGINTGLIRD